jgi:hypothetical protein
MAINTNQWRSIGINGKTSLNYRIGPWCYRSIRAAHMVGRFTLGDVRISATPSRSSVRLAPAASVAPVATNGDLSIW